MSEVKVNKISPRSGTAITLGDSGDTFTIPSGATLAIAGSVTGFTSAGIDDNATSVAITINSSEQVGIGTTSPDHLLHISASSSNAQLKLQRTGSATASYNISASSDSLAFSDQVAGSERMRLTSTGLGIGTSSPTHNLTVDGGTSTNIALIKDATGSATVRYYDGGSQKSYIQLTADENMDFYAGSGVDQIFYGQGTERMRLNGGAVFNEGSVDADFRVESNGNANMLYVDGGNDRVGIGTSTPQNTLHVIKNVISGASYRTNAPLIIENNSNTEIQILSANSSDGQLRFGDADANFRGAITYAHSDDSFTISTNGASQVKIHSNGVMSAADGIALGVGTANTASNVLNDYEEGTFTPIYRCTGNQLSSVTYNAWTGGRYTKVGQLVAVTGTIASNAVTLGSPSGNLRIGGLPFTVAAVTGSTLNTRGAVVMSNQNLWATNHTPNNGNVVNGTTEFDLAILYGNNDDVSSLASTDILTGSLTGGNRLFFTVTYFTDA